MFQLEWCWGYNTFCELNCMLFYMTITIFILLAFSLYFRKIRNWLFNEIQ
jgi:hypothetical protein